MSKADDALKILDANHTIVLFKNQMGSYTGVVCVNGQSPQEALEIDKQSTDDFTVEKVLYRLTEKFTTGRIV